MLNKNQRAAAGLLVCAFGAAANANAQSSETGPGRFQADLKTLVSYTDNYYYQPTDTKSVTAALLRPEIKFDAESSQAVLNLTGAAEYQASSAASSKDNYLDGQTGVNLGWTPTYRNRFFLDGSYMHGHDPFGQVRTEGAGNLGTDLDEWNHAGGGARYRYGAPEARVNAEVGVSVLKVGYTTNRSATQFLDYKSVAESYALYYNCTPKTSLLLDFSRTATDFDTAFPGGPDTRNGETYQVRFGARWQATAKTSGDVRVGYRQRQFDNVPGNLQGLDWQASVQWSPTVPTLVEFRTARSEEQSYRIDASVIDVASNTISIKRTVSERTLASLSLGQSKSKFFGSGRYDTTRDLGVGLEYAANSVVSLLANLGYDTRDSTLDGLNYHRLGGFIGLRLGRLR